MFAAGYVIPPLRGTACGRQVFATGSAKCPKYGRVTASTSNRGSFSRIVTLTGRYRPPMRLRRKRVVNKFTRGRMVRLTSGMMRTMGDNTVHGFIIVTKYSKHVGDHSCCTSFTRTLPGSAIVLATNYTGCHCGGLPLNSVRKVPHILSTKRYGSDCSLTIVTLGLGRIFRLGSVGRLPVVCGVT